MYITYEDYAGIYGEAAITEADFKRLGFRAQRVLDDLTTGVDGVRKLAVAMPMTAMWLISVAAREARVTSMAKPPPWGSSLPQRVPRPPMVSPISSPGRSTDSEEKQVWREPKAPAVMALAPI